MRAKYKLANVFCQQENLFATAQWEKSRLLLVGERKRVLGTGNSIHPRLKRQEADLGAGTTGKRWYAPLGEGSHSCGEKVC